MWHKLFRNDLWILWIMYGVGIVGTCFSGLIVMWYASGSFDSAERGFAIVLGALGPALLGSTFIMHLDYLLEQRRR